MSDYIDRITAEKNPNSKSGLNFIEQPGSDEFGKFILALDVLANHAHINVDTGAGGLDSLIHSLKLQMNDLMRQIFPSLDLDNAHEYYIANEPQRKDEEANILVPKDFIALSDRYRDFPNLVQALDYVNDVVANRPNIKQWFRDNLTATQMGQLENKYEMIFRSIPAVPVKRSDVANNTEKLELERVIASVTPDNQIVP